MLKFLGGVATGVALVFLVADSARGDAAPLPRPAAAGCRQLGAWSCTWKATCRSAPLEVPFLPSERPGITVANVWMALRKAAADPHIRAVVLEAGQRAHRLGETGGVPGDLEQFKKFG